MGERNLFALDIVRRQDRVVSFRISQQPSFEETKTWLGRDNIWRASNGWTFRMLSCPEVQRGNKVLFLRGTERSRFSSVLAVLEEEWDQILLAATEANSSMNQVLFNNEPTLEDHFFSGSDQNKL